MSSVVLRSIASTHHDAHAGEDLGAESRLDADMQHVLDTLRGMDPKRLEACSAEEARAQPTLSMAVAALMRGRYDYGDVAMEMRMIPGPGGEMRARVYRPVAAAPGAVLPVVLYLHGGGFVIGDLDSTSATPRALAQRCRAVVVATHYRQAPAHRHEAAFEDARAAWEWTMANAAALSADPARAALVGEDAGAVLALEVAQGARAAGRRLRHLGLVAPMTPPMTPLGAEDQDTDPPHPAAAGMATIRWYLRQVLGEGGVATDPRLDPAGRGDLTGLPPTTMILARHDPLRAGGEALADALRRAGVWVDATTYEGVTHGFFQLARVVNKAMFAEGQLVRNLNESLASAGRERVGVE